MPQKGDNPIHPSCQQHCSLCFDSAEPSHTESNVKFFYCFNHRICLNVSFRGQVDPRQICHNLRQNQEQTSNHRQKLPVSRRIIKKFQNATAKLMKIFHRLLQRANDRLRNVKMQPSSKISRTGTSQKNHKRTFLQELKLVLISRLSHRMILNIEMSIQHCRPKDHLKRILHLKALTLV